MNFWFRDNSKTASITCVHILEENAPILYVSHDKEDGMWQFLCGKQHDISEARMISLREAYALDDTLPPCKKLPKGYCAQRASKAAPWVIEKKA